MSFLLVESVTHGDRYVDSHEVREVVDSVRDVRVEGSRYPKKQFIVTIERHFAAHHIREHHIVAGSVGGTERTMTAKQVADQLTELRDGGVQTIECVCCDEDDTADDDVPKITDRDVWQPGETYAQLDLVKHPDDVSRRFIAIKASETTSKLVLLNKEFWCELTDEDDTDA